LDQLEELAGLDLDLLPRGLDALERHHLRHGAVEGVVDLLVLAGGQVAHELLALLQRFVLRGHVSLLALAQQSEARPGEAAFARSVSRL
jgi:hypothetical protein